MNHLTQTMPDPASVARPHDPLAVALANASLLSAGYLMMGRRGLAVATGLVTIVVVALLGPVARSAWFEVVVLLWWAAMIGHGFVLAGGRVQSVVARRQRLVALAVVVPVLLAVGLVRLDAYRIGEAVTVARHDGDCARAFTTLDRWGPGHRVVDAPLTVQLDRTDQACRRLRTAQDEFTAVLAGDIVALKPGFDGLASVLTELPGHERMVDVVLGGFLDGVPGMDPCHAAAVTDWLRQRPASNDVLDRSVDVVARTAPVALTGCGDALMAATQWETARMRYQQVLDQYPGDALMPTVQEGIRQATLEIELANVRSLLARSTDTQPEYCSAPARYSGAAPYRKGTNRALIYGNDSYRSKLPASWRAPDVARAVLVICAGQQKYGAAVRSCYYENKTFPRFPTRVTFHKIAIPVKVYELRTGNLVANTTVQISGTSCPRVLRYRTFLDPDFGPPSQVYVTASNAQVRAGFRSVIIR